MLKPNMPARSSALRFLAVLAVVIGAATLTGCETMNKAAQATADYVAPPDPVTGQRTANLVSEPKEIALGNQYETQILADYKSKNVGVDVDAASLAKIKDLLGRLTAVSHRPKLPWRVHLVETGDWNAFATAGGLVVVFRGLYNDINEDELAGVLGHEISHVTCRHITESLSQQQAASLFNAVTSEKALTGDYYKAAYSTIHEDEADRIGLLYMSLAGYNPDVVPLLWQRMDKKYGSDPKQYHYLYDHSLNADRAAKTGKLAPVAKQYYVGEHQQNPQFAQVLLKNDIAPRTEPSGSGFKELLRVAKDNYNTYSEASAEAASREQMAGVPQTQLAAAPGMSEAALQQSRGDMAGAFKGYAQVATKDPTNYMAFYNMAGIAVHGGDPNAAIHYLTLALNRGFADPKMMTGDKDLKPLRGDVRFQALVTAAHNNQDKKPAAK
jgi:predicted Zn-dependent protease